MPLAAVAVHCLEQPAAHVFALPAACRTRGAPASFFGFGAQAADDDDSKDELPEEARGEPKWQDLLQIYYRGKIKEARAAERDAALRKAYEERKVARSFKEGNAYNGLRDDLRRSGLKVADEAGDNPTEEQKKELAKIANLKIQLAYHNNDATEESMEGDDDRRAAEEAQQKAVELEKWAFAGRAAAQDDVELSLEATRNETPGKVAVDSVGQHIESKNVCEQEGMEFEAGKGCFVPGGAKEPVPAEVAASRAIKQAKAKERTTEDRIKVLVEDYRRARGEAIATGNKKPEAAAKAKLDAAKAEKQSDIAAVVEKAQGAMALAQAAKDLDQQHAQADRDEEHAASDAARRDQQLASATENKLVKESEAQALGVKAKALQSKVADPGRGATLDAKEKNIENLKKVEVKTERDLSKGKMETVVTEQLQGRQEERNADDRDRDLLLKTASNSGGAIAAKPKKTDSRVAAEDELGAELKDEAQEKGRLMQAIAKEANALKAEADDDVRLSAYNQMAANAARKQKSSALAVYSARFPPVGPSLSRGPAAGGAASAEGVASAALTFGAAPLPVAGARLAGFL